MITSKQSSIKQFLAPTVEVISQVLELPVSIWLFEQTKKQYRIFASIGLSNEYVDLAFLDPNETSVLTNVLNTGQTKYVTDIQSEKNWKYKSEALRMNLKSAVFEPLLIKKRIVGVLDIYIPKNKDFLFEEKKHIIKSLANQISAVLRQINNLTLLNEVNLYISTELKKSPDLFDRIMQSAQKVLNCEHVSVFLVEGENNDLVRKASSPSPSDLQRERFKSGEGLAGLVAQNGESLIVSDVRDFPEFLPGMFNPDVEERSMLLIPIKLDNNIVGVISADMDGLGGFDEQDNILLEVLAMQAGIAIQNVNLFQKEHTQALALSELNRIAQQLIAIEESSDIKNLLKRIAEVAKKVLNADLIELYEYNTKKKKFVLPQITVGEKLKTSFIEEIFADNAVWQLINYPDPLFEENVKNNPIFADPYSGGKGENSQERFIIREKIKSTAAIPIRINKESIGLMFANYREYQTFSTEKKELIQLFANQAAIAIKNARLYNEVIRRRQILIEIGQKLTEQIYLNEKEILDLIYKQASKLIDTSNMSIALYDEKTNYIHFALAYLFGRCVDIKEEIEWEPRKGGKTEQVIKNKKYLLLSTKRAIKKRGFSPIPGLENSEGKIACSWLGVPMLLGNRVLGVIANHNYDYEHYYSKDDIKILQALANQAGIALENSRLYDNLKNLNNRQKALVEISSKLTSGIRLKETEIYELIYEEASKLLNMENFSIALHDQEKNTVWFVLASVKGERVDVTKPGWGPREGGIGKTETIIQNKKKLLLQTHEEVKNRGFSPTPGDKDYKGEMASSWLGVPMIVGERVLGVIANYCYGQDYYFKKDDIEIMQALADQAAIAIDNTRLFIQLEDINKEQWNLVNQLEKVNRRQDLLVSFGSQLGSRIRYGETELFNFIHEQAHEFMDTDNMYIAIYDNTNDIVRFGLAYKNGEKIEIPSRKAGRGRTEEIIRTGEPIFIATRKESEEWYKQPGRIDYIEDPLASWIGVPMKVENKVIGVIASYHPTKDNLYSKNDLEILQSMADLAAITLENARLYRELDEKILELEKAQEKIAESQTVITRTSIAADFVHRLNNLAGTIPIWVDQISDNLSTDIPNFDDIKKYLDKIQSNTDGLLRAAEQLKALPQPQLVDIKDTLEALVRQTRVQTSEKIEIALECTETLQPINAIASELANALWTIIENGIDAISDEGKLFLKAMPFIEKDGREWIKIQITDSGKGISKEQMDKIFSPFYTTKTGHLGYGLWRAKNIIEKLKGNIKFESQEGKGTTFFIHLPSSMEVMKNG